MKVNKKNSLTFSVNSVTSVVRKILCFILFTFYILSATSCENTDTSKGNISGVVTLENNEDASGVYIAVYDLAELDPIVVEANQRWPHIGVIIDQKTEFDHRLQEAIAYTQSEPDGSYILKDISTGGYNIVFYKPGWGFKYIYNYEVNKGENSINDIELYEETILEGDISTNITMQDAHHYIIQDNVNIVPGAKLTIEPGAVIRINPGKALNIWGEIQAQGEEDNMFRVTSNAGFDEFGIKHEPADIARYNHLMLQSSATITDEIISYGKFDFGTFALNSEENYFLAEYCRFKYSSCGLQSMSASSMDADTMQVTNCNFTFIDGNDGGIFFSKIHLGKIEKSISTNNTIGIRVKDRFNGIIENNYLAHNTYGFEGVHFMGILQHNELTDNSESDIHLTGIYGGREEGMEIYYNNLSSDDGITNFSLWSYTSACRFLGINNNNFFNSNLFIDCSSATNSVDANDNYFNGLSSVVDIQDRIHDGSEDIEVYDVSGFVTVPIGEAGILSE